MSVQEKVSETGYMTEKRIKPLRAAKFAAMAILLFAAIVAVAIIAVSSTFIFAPAWLRKPIEDQLQSNLGARALNLGNIGLSLDLTEFTPVLRIENLRLLDSGGATTVTIEETRIELAIRPLLNRKVRPSSIEVNGVDINLFLPSEGWIGGADYGSEERTAAADSGNVSMPSAKDPPNRFRLQSATEDLLAVLDSGPLASARDLSIDGIDVAISNFDGEEVWNFENGRARFQRSVQGISGQAAVSPASQLGARGEIRLGLEHSSDQMETQIEVSFQELAVDVVVRKLFGLKELISPELVATGSVGIRIDGTGGLRTLDTRLEVGAGTIIARAIDTPVHVTSGDVDAAYNHETGKLEIKALSIDTDVARMSASGSVYIGSRDKDGPLAIFGSLLLKEATLYPPGIFQEPLDSISGTLEFRLVPSAGELEIARFAVAKDATKLVASGTVSSGEYGLGAKIDFRADQLSRNNLLEWWPSNLVPKTRIWLQKNLHDGEFSHVSGAFRQSPGRNPELLLTFRVNRLVLQYLNTLPPVRGGIGHASLSLEEFNMGLEAGKVTVPEFGDISLAGSSYHIPDVKDPTRDSEVRVLFDGRISPVLAILNYPPFGLLDVAGIPLDIVNGHASGELALAFPLIKRIQIEDVGVRATGTISDFSSKEIMGGRTLYGERLDVTATNSGIKISGEGVLGNIPVSGTWSQEFGPDVPFGSQVTGTLTITDTLLDEFDIVLPRQTLSGAARASFNVFFGIGAVPRFVATSELNGLAINLPFLNWSKPAEVLGEFIIEGFLAHPIVLERVEFKANRLSASGHVTLFPDGELEAAIIDSLKYDDWLDATVRIRRLKSGELVYKIKGDMIDFQKVNRAVGLTSVSLGAPGLVELEFDRVRLSSGIALTDLSGTLGSSNSDRNQFSANVNGGPSVNLKVVQTKNGPAIRVGSSDTGAVLRAVKLSRNLHGGSLEAQFMPKPDGNGFGGILEIRNAVAINMPALGEILSYISVVGLMDKFATEGITFDAINAEFDLSESEIVLHQGTAVGQSLGITMNGRLNLSSSEVDVGGVVTPAYALNRLIDTVTPISAIFGMEEGEGLGAVDYALSGPVNDLGVVVNPISAVTPGFLRDLFPDLSPNK